MAIRCGFDAPAMNHAQRSLRSTKCVGTLGAALGVMLGCCLGMVNLLFLDLEKAERMKQAEKMRSLFDAIIAEGWELVNSDRCTLYMLQDLTRTRQDDPMPDHPTSLFTMVRHGVYPSPDELEDAFHSATGMVCQGLRDAKLGFYESRKKKANARTKLVRDSVLSKVPTTTHDRTRQNTRT